ncbi:MAG: hypothetical protein U0V48_15120 [Anaerolineales bacterium]
MKQAKIAPVIVERGGKAEVVVLSKKAAYDQLVAENKGKDWRKLLDEALEKHSHCAKWARTARSSRDDSPRAGGTR